MYPQSQLSHCLWQLPLQLKSLNLQLLLHLLLVVETMGHLFRRHTCHE